MNICLKFKYLKTEVLVGKLFKGCLATKIKKLQGPKWTDFFLLCALKKHMFSATKIPPHEWCSTRCKILPLQLAPFSFTKMQASERGRIPSYPFAGRCIEYGHDKALHQRKGGSPSQLVFRKTWLWDEERTKFGKWIGKLFIRCWVTKKAHFFCHKGSPRMVFYPLQDLAFAARPILLYKDASIRKRKDSFIPLRGEIHTIWPW